MTIVTKLVAGIGLALAPLALDMWAHPAANPLTTELRQLAARAGTRKGRAGLGRFAAAQQDAERRGLAYFTLGVRELEAGEYTGATEDLRQALKTNFSLADFAEYELAVAADKAGRPGKAIDALEGFSARHPQSSLRHQALELLAGAYLENAQPERAIQALTAEARFRQDPAIKLLLARSYAQAEKFEEGAKTFEEVYYAFPMTPESSAASTALERLKAQLGERFPQASEETQTARAELFSGAGRFEEALAEYDALLKARSSSPFAGRWKVGRAKCLLRLRRTREAVEALEAILSTNPEVDAARLEALVDVDARQSDEELMLRELDQLRELYPQSPFYASALYTAGTFFSRRGAWEDAARYYQPLAEGFPQTELGREGAWRQAWSYYLEREYAKASRALLDYLARYPADGHFPSALYWLGRLAEERKAIAEARAYYEFLQKRYAHSYYALQAALRLKGLPPYPPAVTTPSKTRPRSPIAAVVQKIPKLEPPPLRPCPEVKPSEVLRPYLTLKALSLLDLAGEYLEAALAEHPAPDLYFFQAEFNAEQRDTSEALLSARKAVPNFSEYPFAALPEEVWELLFPQAYRPLVERQARANGLELPLVMALIRAESAFNPLATSRANARGLMQILPSTASPSRRGRALVARRLYDPAYNVRFGCRYFRRLLDRYDGSLEAALAAYNAGDPRVQDWLEKRDFGEPAEFMESIPIRETRAYVEAVLRDAEIYRQLLTRTAEFKKCSQNSRVEESKSRKPTLNR